MRKIFKIEVEKIKIKLIQIHNLYIGTKKVKSSTFLKV